VLESTFPADFTHKLSASAAP